MSLLRNIFDVERAANTTKSRTAVLGVHHTSHPNSYVVMFIIRWSAGQQSFATSFFAHSPVLLLRPIYYSRQSHYFAATGYAYGLAFPYSTLFRGSTT
jgi:hypothetical protein